MWSGMVDANITGAYMMEETLNGPQYLCLFQNRIVLTILLCQNIHPQIHLLYDLWFQLDGAPLYYPPKL